MALARLRSVAILTVAIAAIPASGSALAHDSPRGERRLESLPAARLLLHEDDVPGLVSNPLAPVGLSLWESAEREPAKRTLLLRSGFVSGAERTFGQSPFSLYGVLVIQTRVLVFAHAEGARRALRNLPPAGLRRAPQRLEIAGGAAMYTHMDTVSGVTELALATQFRQRNVISRVMIVGTPVVITPAHLLATARSQAFRVAAALQSLRSPST